MPCSLTNIKKISNTYYKRDINRLMYYYARTLIYPNQESVGELTWKTLPKKLQQK